MLLILSVILFGANLIAAEAEKEWKRLIDLRGQWKFSIGDNHNWSDPEFDDSDWSFIYAPSEWEEEGYPGYDGYAWYRKSFNLKEISNNLYLDLGQIDDVDEVYINGKLIGLKGSYPPEFRTAYNENRRYKIPVLYLRKDKANIIAVRVFDAQLEGGIVYGKLGLYRNQADPEYIYPLEGLWKFKTGDSQEWKYNEFDDSEWQELLVPMPWDAQGYKDYDGYAWYRIHFNIDPKYKGEKLVLLLGKIDDFDEVYINGEFIGATGYMEENPRRNEYRDEWLEYRDYKISTNKLFFDGENVLAVRVYDGLQDGGIYKGPVGIITSDEYKNWKKNLREHNEHKKRNLFDILFWKN